MRVSDSLLLWISGCSSLSYFYKLAMVADLDAWPRALQQTMGLHLHFANFCMSYGKRSWACGSGVRVRVLYLTPKLLHCWYCASVHTSVPHSK